ncbi:uncharacterized protein LOC107609957 [Arachis ipaensis]|uniref:uncharacterized protein LOC107609957 n=1 Tax=Arachis ipaensis TaxID=130454 RepID=UPI000A2B0AE3|nr:uncharacterized protein LOC107609957 [Arachis ipaensis]
MPRKEGGIDVIETCVFWNVHEPSPGNGYFCRLLIFDNIENGSLKEHLNDPLKTPLNWRTRLQIANEVVAALVVYASEHSHYIYNKVNFGMDPSQNHKGSQKPSRFDNWCLFCRKLRKLAYNHYPNYMQR